MKKITVTSVILLFLCASKMQAQTPLTVGDVAFTGYINVNTPDEFSFVLLKNIVANTPISFTDKGWRSATSTFDAAGAISPQADETIVIWQHTSSVSAGTEIRIAGTTASLGTVTGTALALAGSGDQIFAFTGSSTIPNPNVITGIHMNVYALDVGSAANSTTTDWDGTANGINANSSQKPTTLTTGTNALWIGTVGVGASEQDNGRFGTTTNCPGSLSTVAGIKAVIFNQTNWQTSDATPIGFTLPTNCPYLVVLPLELIDFRATAQGNKVRLDWSTASESNNAYFDIEHSFDGKNFSKIGQVKGAGTTNMTQYYTYLDEKSISGIHHYRLKQVDYDGRNSYSKKVSVALSKSGKIAIFPTYTEGVVSLKSDDAFIENIKVINAVGQVVLSQNTKFESKGLFEINLSSFPTGLYIISVKTDGNIVSEKVFKK
jgi:Secretion system C-terminal sorting domain